MTKQQCGNEHLRRTGYEDLRIRSKILQIMNVQVSETSGNEMKIGILAL